jgi:hypothetical protein
VTINGYTYRSTPAIYASAKKPETRDARLKRRLTMLRND